MTELEEWHSLVVFSHILGLYYGKTRLKKEWIRSWHQSNHLVHLEWVSHSHMSVGPLFTVKVCCASWESRSHFDTSVHVHLTLEGTISELAI